METLLEFKDKAVRYETFINDVAVRVVTLLKEENKYPEYISQARAFKIFGRANVERWRRQGKIEPCKRPGKLEYHTFELRKLQKNTQDYFE